MVGINIWIQLFNILSFSMDYELQILQSSLVERMSHFLLQRYPQLIHSFLIPVSWTEYFIVHLHQYCIEQEGYFMNLVNYLL